MNMLVVMLLNFSLLVGVFLVGGLVLVTAGAILAKLTKKLVDWVFEEDPSLVRKKK